MKYKAVLIANWTYDQKKGLVSLNGPKHDLDVLFKALTDADCGLYDPADIIQVPDASVSEVRTTLAKFLDDAAADDSLLIYFSGHGLPVSDDLVLCTRETDRDHPLAAGIEVSFINRSLPKVRSEQTIVILDCCFAGQAVKGGLGKLDLNFAQNLFCIASSGAYEVTPDAKTKDTPSPFTAELARLLVEDTTVAVEESGAITVDAVFQQLQKFKPQPVRSAKGNAGLRIARRGELRDSQEKFFNPLDWLPKSPNVQMIPVKVPAAPPGLLDAQLLGLLSRTLELIDGVGRLDDKANGDQWNDVVRSAWRELGTILLRSATSDDVRNNVRTRIATRNESDVVTLSFDLDKSHENCPWEAVHGDRGGTLGDFLALIEGILIERICDVTRPLSNVVGADVPYAVCAANLSAAEKTLSEQIAAELKKRAPEFDLKKAQPWNLEGTKCNWTRFVDTVQPRLLVLTLPLRRVSDPLRRVSDGHQIEICFNKGNEADWKRGEDVLERLQRWNRPHDAVILETVATSPSYNAYSAAVEFSRQLTQQGFGPTVFLCHPPAFTGYPVDDRQIPVTFSGQLIAALLKGTELSAAVHHARSAPLRLNPNVKPVFGFPGYHRPRPLGQSAAGSSAYRSTKEGQTIGEKSAAFGPKTRVTAGDGSDEDA